MKLNSPMGVVKLGRITDRDGTWLVVPEVHRKLFPNMHRKPFVKQLQRLGNEHSSFHDLQAHEAILKL